MLAACLYPVHMSAGMKYVIIIPDGGADLAIASLGDQTPMQAAMQPHTNALARGATVGVQHEFAWV
jgi:2,3-bisphosphoglycerate-independent phosphoglycerate mutase